MNIGYIYCVSTPANTDRCKVGETLKGIENRLKGINNTAVSENFKLDYYIIVDPIKRFNIEKSIHNDIITEGYSRFTGKEFFKCKPNDIKHIFEKYGIIYSTINEHKSTELLNENIKEQNINILLPIKKLRTCEKCKKVFDRKSSYDNHLQRKNSCEINIHIGNKCSFCNKIYTTKYNLNHHVKSCIKKSIIDNNQLQINELKNILLEQQKKIDLLIK
jgi:hypothetical protein